jgi:miniconductance mechanosensitive channel
MFDAIRDWLMRAGLQDAGLDLTMEGLTLLGIGVAAFAANFLAKRVILRVLTHVAGRTRTKWDNVMLEKHVFTRLSHIAPAVVIWYLAPASLAEYPSFAAVMRSAAELYMLLIGLAVAFAFLNAAEAIYTRFQISTRVPITGYLQVIKLVLSIGVGIFALSIVLDKSPWIFLSGLGAATAILLLIFKDAILGFVAGIQLAANDMVRPGDWISMPKYGADGDVVELNLTTVKVSNWDKTISTIPTYALISDSFKNWRGMSESGGRRIKRSISIDVNSIKFCTSEMIERFAKIERVRGYVEKKRSELAEYNRSHDVDESVLVNGRRMTNIGTFREYLVTYLREHPDIHQQMTLLVRHLQPTEKGLPLEIYVFSADQDWGRYEAIQADIFDHIFAAIGEFDLHPFQYPTNASLATLVHDQDT